MTGGGSGHEPAFLGYVGEGLVDAVAIGEVFSSPTAKSFLDAFVAADGGAGVACLYGNYAGDNMNVKMAVRQAASRGITVRTVVANDDVPSAPAGEREKRRGVAGEILMWKAGGGSAAEGRDLDGVIAAAQKAIDNTRSIGIGLAPCTIAAVGKPNFAIEDGMMEVGIGHHGEPGLSVMPLRPAREMADLMLDSVLPDLPFERGRRRGRSGLRPRRDAGDGAVHPLRPRGGSPGGARHGHPPPLRRQPVYLPRDGRRHPHSPAARRGARTGSSRRRPAPSASPSRRGLTRWPTRST